MNNYKKIRKKSMKLLGGMVVYFNLVFNDETLYRSYKKKCDDLPFCKE